MRRAHFLMIFVSGDTRRLAGVRNREDTEVHDVLWTVGSARGVRAGLEMSIHFVHC